MIDEAKKPKKAKKEKAPEPPPPKGEDPKRLFKTLIAPGTLAAQDAVGSVLQYMPDDFVEAHKEGRYAHWDNPYAMDSDWWPIYDDDRDDPDNPNSNPWSQVIYYWEYETDQGKLFGHVMEGDRDGNHDIVLDAEVGSEDYKAAEEAYGPKGWTQAMRAYWEWVRDHGRDPLDYIMVPTREVERKWVAAFVKDGERLKLVALRKLSPNPPSPPAVPAAQALQKGDEDAEWREAIDYLLLDQNGYSEATQAEVEQEGGKWDRQQRLVVHFSFKDREAEENAQAFIIQKAEEALAALDEHPNNDPGE